MIDIIIVFGSVFLAALFVLIVDKIKDKKGNDLADNRII